jgi:hypothetical protein
MMRNGDAMYVESMLLNMYGTTYSAVVATDSMAVVSGK